MCNHTLAHLDRTRKRSFAPGDPTSDHDHDDDHDDDHDHDHDHGETMNWSRGGSVKGS